MVGALPPDAELQRLMEGKLGAFDSNPMPVIVNDQGQSAEAAADDLGVTPVHGLRLRVPGRITPCAPASAFRQKLKRRQPWPTWLQRLHAAIRKSIGASRGQLAGTSNREALATREKLVTRHRDVRKNTENQSSTRMYLVVDPFAAPATAADLRRMRDLEAQRSLVCAVADTLLLRRLRQDLGLVYSINCSYNYCTSFSSAHAADFSAVRRQRYDELLESEECSDGKKQRDGDADECDEKRERANSAPLPVLRQQPSVSISFTSAPRDASACREAVLDTLDKLSTEGPAEADYAAVLEQWRRARMEETHDNDHYITTIVAAIKRARFTRDFFDGNDEGNERKQSLPVPRALERAADIDMPALRQHIRDLSHPGVVRLPGGSMWCGDGDTSGASEKESDGYYSGVEKPLKMLLVESTSQCAQLFREPEARCFSVTLLPKEGVGGSKNEKEVETSISTSTRGTGATASHFYSRRVFLGAAGALLACAVWKRARK